MKYIIGQNVPWNASWSAEADTGFKVKRCQFSQGQRAIWQIERPGVGVPIFAKPHPVRQRQSIDQMLCTVCGKPTLEGMGDRWWFGFGMLNDGHFMTSESPVHHRCAKISERLCPRIRAFSLKPQPWPDGSRKLMAFVGGKEVENDFGIRVKTGQIVVGSLKLGWPIAEAMKIPEIARHIRPENLVSS